MKKNLTFLFTVFLIAPNISADTLQQMEEAISQYAKTNQLFRRAFNAHTGAAHQMKKIGGSPKKVQTAIAKHFEAKDKLKKALNSIDSASMKTESVSIPEDVKEMHRQAADLTQSANMLHASAAEKMYNLVSDENQIDPATATAHLQSIAKEHSLAADKLEAAAAAHKKIAISLHDLGKNQGDMLDARNAHAEASQDLKVASKSQSAAAQAVQKAQNIPLELENAKKSHDDANKHLHQVALAQQKVHNLLTKTVN